MVSSGRELSFGLEISFLSSLLFLAGDVLAVKFRADTRLVWFLVWFFFPLHGVENPRAFQTGRKISVFPVVLSCTYCGGKKKTQSIICYLHSSGDVGLFKAVNGTSMAASFCIQARVSSFHSIAVCMQRLLV